VLQRFPLSTQVRGGDVFDDRMGPWGVAIPTEIKHGMRGEEKKLDVAYVTQGRCLMGDYRAHGSLETGPSLEGAKETEVEIRIRINPEIGLTIFV